MLWRVGLGWYLFALVGLPAILALGTIVVPGNLAWASSVALPEDSSSMEFRIYYKRLPAYQSRERTTDLSPPRS
jgi:hypothetical protein